MFCFHFPDGLDNSGFVGWLATHLKETLGTSVFVICGQNSDRGGIFDYWACPLNLGDEVAGMIVEKLVTLSASSQDNNAGKYERSIDVFFYGLFMDVKLLRSQSVMPSNPRRAFVEGFNLPIGRRAMLIPTEGARAYGMLIALTHGEIVPFVLRTGTSTLPAGSGVSPYNGRPGLSGTLLQPCGAPELFRAESCVCGSTQGGTSVAWFPSRVYCVHSVAAYNGKSSFD